MSRQRTKIGEHWRVGVNDYESAADARVYRKPGERIVKVTRYRLAPLVELPPFAIAEDTGVMTSASDERGVFAAYGRADDNGMWWAAVGSGGAMLRHRLGFEGGSRMHWWRTEEEALANCAERLRELGYRVAKAKKGGAS